VSATARKEQRPGSALRSRALIVVAMAALMLVLPTAVVVLAVADAPAASTGPGASGLSPAWDKPVHFIETGLALGTNWSVNLRGSIEASNGSEINFSEIPGTYGFAVIPVVGYTAVPSAGNVTVPDCPNGVTVHITFTPVTVPSRYTIFFNETGLPAGTTWWVNLDGNNSSRATSSISFSVLNGTYPYTNPAVLSGSPGVQFLTVTSSGSVVVNGADVVVAVPYSTQYFLTTIVFPPGEGSVTPGSGWYPAGASVGLSAVPSAGYGFFNWSGSGTGNYSGTSATPTITMNAPITENATFGPVYSVDFEEMGLADGVTWSVTFNGVTHSAFYVFLDFSAVNGTYPYTVAPIPGYHTDSYGGHVTVAGSDVTVIIKWVRVTYNVSFVEAGLPSGTRWSVTLNGSPESLAGASIVFVEPNGTLPWTVAPVSGYTANVTSGTVIIHGANVAVYLGWTTATTKPSPTYTVSFVETGLPTGTDWTVSLNSTVSVTVGSPTDVVEFVGVAVGTYGYWVPNVGTYQPAISSGPVEVSGANVTVDVTFTTLAPAVHPPTSVAISIWDLLMFAFIAGGSIIVTYLIFRRS